MSGTQGPGGDVWQGIEFVQTAKKAKLTTNKTMTVDEICLWANVGAKQANVAIFNMLMRGIVREESGKRYLRNN